MIYNTKAEKGVSCAGISRTPGGIKDKNEYKDLWTD